MYICTHQWQILDFRMNFCPYHSFLSDGEVYMYTSCTAVSWNHSPTHTQYEYWTRYSSIVFAPNVIETYILCKHSYTTNTRRNDVGCLADLIRVSVHHFLYNWLFALPMMVVHTESIHHSKADLAVRSMNTNVTMYVHQCTSNPVLNIRWGCLNGSPIIS